MSTRASVIVTDKWGGKIWLYRHSDGYPDGTMPTLTKFLDWVKQGRIRADAMQAAGWLVLIGNQEYGRGVEPGEKDGPFDWKVGSYEPTDGQTGGIECLYTVDLAAKTITHVEVS